MAAGSLGQPGTKYGPCLDEQCGHRDCEFSRRQAACVCRICKQPIGYDSGFFVEGSPMDLVHEACLWEEAEAEHEHRKACMDTETDFRASARTAAARRATQ